ncbi:Cardiolipin synthase (CMP-forming) [Rhodotorula toruloides]|nr:Cardiolipin synthase (CMP-forming) [Rhodotorula toruloides]
MAISAFASLSWWLSTACSSLHVASLRSGPGDPCWLERVGGLGGDGRVREVGDSGGASAAGGVSACVAILAGSIAALRLCSSAFSEAATLLRGSLRPSSLAQRPPLLLRPLTARSLHFIAPSPQLARPPLSHARWIRPNPLARSFISSRSLSTTPDPSQPPPTDPKPSAPLSSLLGANKQERRENIYTIPNALTVGRIIACPAIGYYILKGDLATATGLLFVAGVSDLLDGWLARRFNMGSVLGSILDPAADKLLMTTMVITLAMRDMLPLPLAVLILGRDIALSISAFYFRYASLPPPKTFARYWDFSIPSASVHPTTISKYNTFLQLLLVGASTVAPLVPWDVSTPLTALQWIVAGTTVWSGLSYVGAGSSAAVKYIK